MKDCFEYIGYGAENEENPEALRCYCAMRAIALRAAAVLAIAGWDIKSVEAEEMVTALAMEAAMPWECLFPWFEVSVGLTIDDMREA